MEWTDTGAGSNSPEAMPLESRANRESVRELTNALQTFNFQLNIICGSKAKHKTVLIDTPVGPYFLRFLEENIAEIGENVTMKDIQATFKEIKPEFIRTSLKKMWLEDFYIYC